MEATLRNDQGETMEFRVTRIKDGKLAVADNRLPVSYRFVGKEAGVFTTEISPAMPGCDGPVGRFVADGQPPQLEGVKAIVLEDAVLGDSLTLHASKPVRFAAWPLFGVSRY